jgi:hypothetical protein
MAQLLQCFELDLPNTFTGKVEMVTDLLERLRILTIEAETHDHDFLFPLIERV